MEDDSFVPLAALVRPVVGIIVSAKDAVVTEMVFSAARRFASQT